MAAQAPRLTFRGRLDHIESSELYPPFAVEHFSCAIDHL